MSQDSFRRKPQQDRSRSVVNAITTALEQMIDRTTDAAEISMRTVAKRAGVGVASLYEYFDGQDGLLGEFLSKLTNVNFDVMASVVDRTKDEPLDLALKHIFEHAMSIYLDSPKKTQAAINFIMRLGWTGPVVRERDRFADLMADRIRQERPTLDEGHTRTTMRLVLDAGMGIVVNELWRPTPHLRTHVLELMDGMLHRRLGVNVRTTE